MKKKSARNRISVFFHSQTSHAGQAQDAVTTVNHLQSHFQLLNRPVEWLPNDEGEEKKVGSEAIRKRALKATRGGPFVALILNPLDDNSFSHEYREGSVVSLADWESSFAPPPLHVYIAYQIAGAMLNTAADIPEVMLDEWQHSPPIGCFFDNFKAKELIRLGMVGANLCGECEVKLAGMQLPDAARASVEAVLAWVRGATIRRPRMTPDRVFVGHGRSDEWKKLKRFLEEKLNLVVEEFNQRSAAGMSTTERVMEMLDRSRFAFLVMTREDQLADGTKRARENVVHELGLFQGRLGYRSAIAVVEEGCTLFSNIAGLTYIGFKSGRLQDKWKEIEKTLELAGLRS